MLQYLLQGIEKMKKYKIKFIDIIEAESEENAYDIFIKYLQECVEYRDVTAFEFYEVKQ